MIRINDGTVRMRYQLKSKMLERIVDRRNMEKALKAVERNGGAAGVDDLQSDELRQFLNTSYQSLCEQILKGTYKPKAVLKVEIPKVQGGVRMLGIPTVTDRMIQQAIHQVLSPVYEEQFDKKSFGFRRGRNAHQAVQAAKENINAGYGWIIELDLEKFFDKVNHQKLMALLSNTVKDKGTLKLIHAYLKSGIMEGGVVSPRTEGTPQGSPLALRTHLQTLIFPGRYRLKEVSFDYIIKSSIFMINGKSTELGISQAYQPGIYFAAKGKTSAADSGTIDAEVRVSPIQAYRYIQLAREINQKMGIPESSVVFTVKLPPTLIRRIKKLSGSKGLSISKVVHTALEEFLAKKDHAKKGETS